MCTGLSLNITPQHGFQVSKLGPCEERGWMSVWPAVIATENCGFSLHKVCMLLASFFGVFGSASTEDFLLAVRIQLRVYLRSRIVSPYLLNPHYTFPGQQGSGLRISQHGGKLLVIPALPILELSQR
jgi:hypothetical protein